MSNPYTKTLLFTSNNLGKDANLLLVFDNSTDDGMYVDYYPVVLQTYQFPSTGSSAANFAFSSQLAFLTAQVNSGNVVTGNWTSISDGQQATLNKYDGALSFSAPQSVNGLSGVALVNGTSETQIVGLGFSRYGDPAPVPTYIWDRFQSGANITTKFQPTLSAYIVSEGEYQNQQILRGKINTQPLLQQDLSMLNDSTTYSITYDPATGQFAITQN